MIDIQPVKYGNYKFPDWAPFVGWCLSLTSVSAIPIVMVLQVLKERGPIIERIKWLTRPAADFGPKHFRSDNSSDEDCNDDCYRQIANLRNNNRKGKKDVLSLSDKHVDSQIPLASNFDDDDEETEIDDIYNNNLTSEQQKRLNKQYSIDYRSDDVQLRSHSQVKDSPTDNKRASSKKCMYSRQNMNFVNDELWPVDDSGLHMKLNFHHLEHQTSPNKQLTTTNKSGQTNSDNLANQLSKFNETNF